MVKVYGALNSSVTDDIPMRKILGEDATARFLLLGDVVGIAIGVCCVRGTFIGFAVRGGDDDLRRAELGVIEKQGCLGSRLLLESHGGILSSVRGRGNLDVGDLSAVGTNRLAMLDARARFDITWIMRLDLPEAEEFLHLLLFGFGRDILDVDGEVGSHDGPSYAQLEKTRGRKTEDFAVTKKVRECSIVCSGRWL